MHSPHSWLASRRFDTPQKAKDLQSAQLRLPPLSSSAAPVPSTRDAAAVPDRPQVAVWQPHADLVSDADPVVAQVVLARKDL